MSTGSCRQVFFAGSLLPGTMNANFFRARIRGFRFGFTHASAHHCVDVDIGDNLTSSATLPHVISARAFAVHASPQE